MLLPVTNVTASTSPAQARSDEDLPAKEPQDLDSVLQKLDDLISDRVFGTAQAELDLAFNRFGEQAKLLSRLAALRSEEDLFEEAMLTYRRALTADPADTEVAAAYCDFLHTCRMERMALDFVAGLAPDVAGSPRPSHVCQSVAPAKTSMSGRMQQGPLHV
jgi:hypothetical protein